MTPTWTRTFTVLCALALPCGALPSARADEAETKAAAQRLVDYFDKNAPRVKDDGRFADLVTEMSKTPHPITITRIGTILGEDESEERKLIAAFALADMKKPPEILNLAGAEIVKGLAEGMPDQVVEFVMFHIGRMKYVEGVTPVCNVLRVSKAQWVMVEGVRTCGLLEDMRALPTLLELWERFPVGVHWEGGETKVDTGAAGDADQKAAEAKYKQSHRPGKKGSPEVLFKTYIQELAKAVGRITKDQTLTDPTLLRAWMEARVDQFTKLGLEIPKAKENPDAKKDKKDKDKKK